MAIPCVGALGTGHATVHALLRHLHDVGFDGAPRPLGLEGDVGILTFVHGGEATHSDEELARVGGLIRAFHDASRSFVAPAEARWQFMVGAPREGGLICHNDLSPDNTIYGRGGLPRAFIDWDLAAPAPPLWDFGWAAYRFVPLYDDPTCERLGYPTGRQPERLRILSDAYGLEERAALLATVSKRIRVLFETARAWGEERSPRLARRLGRHTRRDPRLLALPTLLLDGKEGVDGSSPSEGFAKTLQISAFSASPVV